MANLLTLSWILLSVLNHSEAGIKSIFEKLVKFSSPTPQLNGIFFVTFPNFDNYYY